MAIKIGQAFERTSANPIDLSLTLTKAQMLAVDDDLMPNKYFTVCQDDGKLYMYDKNATPNAQTGKYSIVSGGGNTESIELTQAQYDALSDDEKNNGTVYFITDGRGGGAGMTKTVLYENPNPSDNPMSITLSDAMSNYDEIMFLVASNTSPSTTFTASILSDDIDYTSGTMIIGYEDASEVDRRTLYRVDSPTELTRYQSATTVVKKIYGITFGSSLDGTIGRWEKIVEIQGSEIPAPYTIDFSKYNAITITSIAPFGEVNECFTTVKDFTVGRRLTTSYFDLNPDQNRTVTIERTGEDTISISNANGMGICIYGYKETGLSNADVKRVANEVGNVVSVPSGGTTGQVLTKKTDADGDTEWKDGGSALPTGGTTGQLLAKKSNTVGDVEWINNSSDLSNANAGVRIGTYHDGRAIYQRSIIFNSMTFTQEGSIWVCKDVPIIARNMRVDIIDVDFIIQKPLAANPDYIQFQTPVPSTCWTYEVDGTTASTRQELGVTYQEYGKPIGGGGYVFAVWAHVSASSNYFNGSSAVVTVKYMQR